MFSYPYHIGRYRQSLFKPNSRVTWYIEPHQAQGFHTALSDMFASVLYNVDVSTFLDGLIGLN